MDTNTRKKIFIPLILFFIFINSTCMVLGKWLDDKKINHQVLMMANLLLAIIFISTAFVHVHAIKNPNPNVYVRSIMASSFIKLLLLAIAASIYILNAGDAISPYSIFASMLLYIVYTVIEKKGLAALQVKKNGDN